eukprot:GHVL01037149.1.p1 GENE.GHVL01037149.1~~GHVL01037149.1.p1  ORF type:complete len:326 (-),score=52.04 GHVL01037149.1:1681-2658(-)
MPAEETTAAGKIQERSILNRFTQQRLKAWQPILTPRLVIILFLTVGTIFVIIGSILLISSQSLIECTVQYEDPSVGGSITTLTIDNNNCNGGSDDMSKIEGPIYFYYYLTRHYQNHRRNVRSRSDVQLRGDLVTDESELSTCSPFTLFEDTNLIRSPCGMTALSVFNDTYTMSDANGDVIIDDSEEIITWETDRNSKYKNSPVNPMVVQWLDETIFPGKVTNGHFIAWMKLSGLPNFKKLWGKISEDLTFPITIEVNNRYPVKSYDGTKSVVIATTNWTGGKNNFIGIAYIIGGSLCFLFGIIFTIRHILHPRALGDIKYLYWVS